MIENFDKNYSNFFEEPNYQKRWASLKILCEKDYWTFRVLFLVETLAIIEKWSEPTQEQLNKLLNHQLDGGILAVNFTSLEKFILPIWPLEMAKYDVLIYRTFLDQENEVYKQFFFTSLKLHFAAIVQTWWAFETLMNDFAGIIKDTRSDTLSPTDIHVLNEIAPSLNKKGEVETKTFYQPLDARIQYIYRLLTGEELNRESKMWNDIMVLKNTRDLYQHRLGKEDTCENFILNKRIAIDGMQAVQKVIEDIFTKTPEFSDRFIYTYFRHWSCGTTSPFVWDGRCGNGFCFGLIKINLANIIGTYAPMPNSFSPAHVDDNTGIPGN